MIGLARSDLAGSAFTCLPQRAATVSLAIAGSAPKVLDGLDLFGRFNFKKAIDEICGMAWEELDNDEVMRVAKAYYYFSIQFRENLEIACAQHPGDPKLAELWKGECDTNNLSPWPGVAAPGERMNHDEFMRRLLELHPAGRDERLTAAGLAYLDKTRQLHDGARASSIASYEDGGLSSVFGAMLRARHWDGQGQRAFRFFLEEHIRFDSADGAGHGELTRHLRAWTSMVEFEGAPVDPSLRHAWRNQCSGCRGACRGARSPAIVSTGAAMILVIC
jgi:hypothetical protein